MDIEGLCVSGGETREQNEHIWIIIYFIRMKHLERFILKNIDACFFSQSSEYKLICSVVLGLRIFESIPGGSSEVAKLRTRVLELYAYI